MSEENIIIAQENKINKNTITLHNQIPYAVISDDLEAAKKSDYYNELAEIMSFYDVYENGSEFVTEGSNGDYIPSDLRYKKAASLVKKEARFFFANPPTFNVNINGVDRDESAENTVLQDFLNKVLSKNKFNDKLAKAAKDCFIGKRVAIVLNFNEKQGISITFLRSFEFIYMTNRAGELTKIVAFYEMQGTLSRKDQKWFKKVYELENDTVYVQEDIYDGLGVLVEAVTKRKKTKFTYIPAVVILNDGLTGDQRGVSEISELLSFEGSYSKMANADMDAGRKSMNPTRYTIDASQESTENLSISPGSFWDIQTDDTKSEDMSQAQVGLLEPSMNYSPALKTTLDRLDNSMYNMVDVPNISSDQLKGMITSGKTLKALYWPLVVRCDEKMLAWGPALQFIAETIIDGGKLYPNCIAKYTLETVLPDISYEILVENNYPLPEDVEEEKTMDLAEISAQAMSRKSYLKKWRGLSDKEADKELKQIKFEQDLFENSQILPPDGEDAGGIAQDGLEIGLGVE